MAEKNIISPPQPNQKLDPIEEKELKVKEDELNREIADLDSELKKLSLNAQFVNEINQTPEPDPTNNKKNEEDLPILNRKGEIVIDNEEIKRRYKNSFPIIRNFHLPFCYQSIRGKIYFWMVWSWPLSYAYNVKKILESGKSWKELTFKPVLKYYGIIFGIGSLLSVAESFFVEDFCDVNSYHYMDNMNKANIVNELKKKFINRVEKKH